MRRFIAARINQLMQLFLEFDSPPQNASSCCSDFAPMG